MFYDVVVTAVAGRRAWTNEIKSSQTISDCKLVSVSDEAYAELIIANYWNRFKDTTGPTKWTDGRDNAVLQHGWSTAGHNAFNEMFKRFKRQRTETEAGVTAEQLFLSMAQDQLTGKKRKRKTGGEMLLELDVMTDDW